MCLTPSSILWNEKGTKQMFPAHSPERKHGASWPGKERTARVAAPELAAKRERWGTKKERL